MVTAPFGCYMAGARCAVSAQVLYTPYNHAPVCTVALFEATNVGCMCLVVTCYLHFGQNDRDLLRATAVTRGGTDTELRVSAEG